jgi:hypothetical protein
MPLIPEHNAASMESLMNERDERRQDVAALWAELHRLFALLGDEEAERREAIGGPWRALRSLTFDDIHGVLEGERAWATDHTPRPGS